MTSKNEQNLFSEISDMQLLGEALVRGLLSERAYERGLLEADIRAGLYKPYWGGGIRRSTEETSTEPPVCGGYAHSLIGCSGTSPPPPAHLSECEDCALMQLSECKCQGPG